MKYNYHTHTELCNHAKGSNEEFVLAAIEAGFDEIGFADHSPWPFENFVSGMRMTADELEMYCRSVKALKEKYKDKISIKLGLECEFSQNTTNGLKKRSMIMVLTTLFSVTTFPLTSPAVFITET